VAGVLARQFSQDPQEEEEEGLQESFNPLFAGGDVVEGEQDLEDQTTTTADASTRVRVYFVHFLLGGLVFIRLNANGSAYIYDVVKVSLSQFSLIYIYVNGKEGTLSQPGENLLSRGLSSWCMVVVWLLVMWQCSYCGAPK
jgi:hypothetical protein